MDEFSCFSAASEVPEIARADTLQLQSEASLAIAASTIQRAWRKHWLVAANKQKTASHARSRLALLALSDSYKALVNSSARDQIPGGSTVIPSAEERDYMQLLNSAGTFVVAGDLEFIVNHAFIPLLDQATNARRHFNEYSPLIIEWIGVVLNIDVADEHNLISLIWDGDILCRLCTVLYPKVRCQLLSRGREHLIHKITFFLEFCRTIGIRGSALFTLSDLVLGVEADLSFTGVFTVLRTIVALEKQARKKGFAGPKLDLKRGKREAVVDALSPATSKSSEEVDAVKQIPEIIEACIIAEESNDVELAAFIESEITHIEALEGLQGLITSKRFEISRHIAQGVYEDTVELDLLRDTVNLLMTAHRSFLAHIHANGDVQTGIDTLIIGIEKCIFLYDVAVSKVGAFLELLAKLPMTRLQVYRDSGFVHSRAAGRIILLCAHLNI